VQDPPDRLPPPWRTLGAHSRSKAASQSAATRAAGERAETVIEGMAAVRDELIEPADRLR
jgi:hypothetical protein